uniref:Uncharacterized protein n=1 Tax=Coturnix japonica TaxID=93934 RepID=A0A8C2YAJ2_COTJA
VPYQHKDKPQKQRLRVPSHPFVLWFCDCQPDCVAQGTALPREVTTEDFCKTAFFSSFDCREGGKQQKGTSWREVLQCS